MIEASRAKLIWPAQSPLYAWHCLHGPKIPCRIVSLFSVWQYGTGQTTTTSTDNLQATALWTKQVADRSQGGSSSKYLSCDISKSVVAEKGQKALAKRWFYCTNLKSKLKSDVELPVCCSPPFSRRERTLLNKNTLSTTNDRSQGVVSHRGIRRLRSVPLALISLLKFIPSSPNTFGLFHPLLYDMNRCLWISGAFFALLPVMIAVKGHICDFTCYYSWHGQYFRHALFLWRLRYFCDVKIGSSDLWCRRFCPSYYLSSYFTIYNSSNSPPKILDWSGCSPQRWDKALLLAGGDFHVY